MSNYDNHSHTKQTPSWAFALYVNGTFTGLFVIVNRLCLRQRAGTYTRHFNTIIVDTFKYLFFISQVLFFVHHRVSNNHSKRWTY